jgi:hypothetical protein
MKIKILNDGIYNNAGRSAVEVEAGAEFDTSPGYAAVLVNDGLAEYIEGEEPPADVTKAKKSTRRATAQSGKEKVIPASANNPFVS